MITNVSIKKNEYRDSVFLMVVNDRVRSVEGVNEVVVMMATENNKGLIREAGFSGPEVDSATANDMVIGLQARDASVIQNAQAEIEALLNQKARASETGDVFKTLDSAVRERPEVNFALISVPGAYAARETLQALNLGVNVLLFSDNVSLEEEVRVKQAAVERGLIVMGPDCGTAIINQVPLAFANQVSPGKIGLVSASGTGLQEVSVLIDRAGEGISQAIGTGGRDLSDEVGGLTTLKALEILEQDRDTEVIVLISKPPAASTMEKVLARVANSGKPVIINFLGADTKSITARGFTAAKTLEEAAALAVEALSGSQIPLGVNDAELERIAAEEAARMKPQQRYARGLYSGGTLCYETLVVWKDLIGDAYANTPLNKDYRLDDVRQGKENSCIDLGDDVFTQGRPHPMISPETRNHYILSEAQDEEVAVLLLDIVLGYGSHEDMAGALEASIRRAREIVAKRGGYLTVLASVCGTDKDPQNRTDQISKLERAGAIVLPSNAQAARLAGAIVRRLAMQRGQGV